MILLITIAYFLAIFQCTEMSKKAGKKICISPFGTEKKIPETEYIGRWRKMESSGLIISIDILNLYKSKRKLTPNKRRFYQQGIRAANQMVFTS